MYVHRIVICARAAGLHEQGPTYPLLVRPQVLGKMFSRRPNQVELQKRGVIKKANYFGVCMHGPLRQDLSPR